MPKEKGKAEEPARSKPEEITLSGGAVVRVSPFPLDLWWDFQDRARRDHPDPEPPKKTIKVVDGTEEVDDLKEPGYVEAKREAEAARNVFMTEAILDLCVRPLDGDWKRQAERLARYSTEAPDGGDEDDLRLFWLRKCALRVSDDYDLVVDSAVSQMFVSDPEVRRRLEFFQRALEGAEAPDADAPGAAEA